MKIWLPATEAECHETAERRAVVVTVMAVSKPYPDGPPSKLTRTYKEVRVAP
jgi:hypothetical protein